MRFGALPTTSNLASTTPDRDIPNFCAAEDVTSPIRSGELGPRSLTRRMTLFLFFKFVTLTLVPKGSDLCAIVIALALNRSPLAVLRPLNLLPYQAIFPEAPLATAVVCSGVASNDCAIATFVRASSALAAIKESVLRFILTSSERSNR